MTQKTHYRLDLIPRPGNPVEVMLSCIRPTPSNLPCIAMGLIEVQVQCIQQSTTPVDSIANGLLHG